MNYRANTRDFSRGRFTKDLLRNTHNTHKKRAGAYAPALHERYRYVEVIQIIGTTSLFFNASINASVFQLPDNALSISADAKYAALNLL